MLTDACRWLFVGLGAVLVWLPGGAGAKPTQSDQDLLDKVKARLFAVAQPVEGWAWPPVATIDNDPEVNAYASLEKPKDAGDGKWQPAITIHQGYMDKVVQGKEARLAELIGHELSHILLRHVEHVSTPGTPLVASAITREHEVAADSSGFQLALKAGYSYPDLLECWQWKRQVMGDYVAFEGMNYDHPSMTERLAHVVQPEEQKKLWRSVNAFENGVYFLACEQYGLAQRCFRQVTREFPNCYEGWNNLGYAQLMTYCDQLDPQDVSSFDVGQLAIGGFYARADSLATRAMDVKLWSGAVEALREALKIKPDLIVPKSNLAVAYLVRPPSVKDAGSATELFEQVAKALQAGSGFEPLDPLTKAELLVNAGVVELAANHSQLSQNFFDQAQVAFTKVGAQPASTVLAGAVVSQALLYNRACLLAASKEDQSRHTAVAEFERYLRSGNQALAWWHVAYDRYQKLCTELGLTPQSQAALSTHRAPVYRVVTSVVLRSGAAVSLTDSLPRVLQRLGDGVHLPIVPQTDLQRVRYADQGLDLLATDQILAICLLGKEAPPVRLKARGLGSDSQELRIGMSEKELDDVLRSEASFQDQRQYTNASVNFQFYRRLGVGVRIDGGTVNQILVAQIPVEDRSR